MIEYDPMREEYFGLRKLKNIINARGGEWFIRNNFKSSDSAAFKVGRSSKTSAEGKFSPPGTGISAKINHEISWNEEIKPISNLEDVKIKSLNELKKIIDKANNNVIPGRNVSNHNIYGISGDMMHSFKKHDDFRHVPLSEAPTIVIWVYQFEHKPREYTWVVLSGTPQGQHRDFREDVIVRSGSGTENLFEEFYAMAFSTRLVDPKEFSTDNFNVHKLIIGDRITDKNKITPGQAGSIFSPIRREAVFQVLRVENKLESDTKPYKSLMNNPDNYEDSRVTRIVYGSPYLVQYCVGSAEEGNQAGEDTRIMHLDSESRKKSIFERFFGL